MSPDEIIELLIESHLTKNTRPIELHNMVFLIPQVDYSGKMARRAWRGTGRFFAHRNRYYCGMLDFKIVTKDQDGEDYDMLHHELIEEILRHMSKEHVIELYNGASPEMLGLENSVEYLGHTLTAAFVEQELNWGTNDFQLSTYFGKPKSKDPLLRNSSPRAFLMTYILKCFNEIENGLSIEEVIERYVTPHMVMSDITNSMTIYPPLRRNNNGGFTPGIILSDYQPFVPSSEEGFYIEKWVDDWLETIEEMKLHLGENPYHPSNKS